VHRGADAKAAQPIVVALSGHVASGKTTLAEGLVTRFGFLRFTTRSAILQLLPDTEETRAALQAAGERLDRDLGGIWVVKALHRAINREPFPTRVVVDSVRTTDQIRLIRRLCGGRILHVHLTAPMHVLASRFSAIAAAPYEDLEYSTVLKNKTERLVDELGEMADLTIDTDSSTVNHVVTQVAMSLSLTSE
jgi:adenylosuccinate synthase